MKIEFVSLWKKDGDNQRINTNFSFPIQKGRIMNLTAENLKRSIRNDIPNLDEIWKHLNSEIEKRIDEIEAQKKEGISPIPIIEFEDVQNSSNSIDRDRIKKAGCIIIKNVFPQRMAEDWNTELKDYLKRNDYLGQKVDAEDTYFGSLKNSKPQVYGIYWSKPQIEARQHENMFKVQCFLNGFWNDHGKFSTDKILSYADRIRMREPQDTSFGLSPHLDSGSVERWLEPNYRNTYNAILKGKWEDYDPFDLSSRLEVEFIPSPAICRVFRSFQGWTALTAQGEGDGTLQVIPMLKEATTYLMLRPFMDDVPYEDWCGSLAKKAFNVSKEWHEPLIRGLCSIPKLQPGDTVWWHPDLIHSVEKKHEGKEYSNVMFVGATPYCEKNKKYIEIQKGNFLDGRSAPDFAAEDREVNYKNRATFDDLTELGKEAMGFLDY